MGAGGFGREVLWLARCVAKRYGAPSVVGFLDDNPQLHGKVICDAPVLGGLDWLEGPVRESIQVVLGIGEPSVKRRVVIRIEKLGLEGYSLIHPTCQMSSFVELGEGAIIATGSVLTTQVLFGRWVTVNLNCTIGHDVVVGDCCTLAPGTHLSGRVVLEEGVKIGTGAVVLPGVRIGKWTTVGAGAVVAKDLPSRVVAVGVPAKVVRTKSEDESVCEE